MRTQDGQPIWNIYLEKIASGYRVVMPPEPTGQFEQPPNIQDGIAVSWPVNPHFTGKSGIISMLQCYDKFRGVSFS